MYECPTENTRPKCAAEQIADRICAAVRIAKFTNVKRDAKRRRKAA